MPWTWTCTSTLTSSRIDSFAHLGQHACSLYLLKKNRVAPWDGPAHASRQRQKLDRVAVDVQLLVRKHAASSLRQRPRSRRRPRPRLCLKIRQGIPRKKKTPGWEKYPGPKVGRKEKIRDGEVFGDGGIVFWGSGVVVGGASALPVSFL